MKTMIKNNTRPKGTRTTFEQRLNDQEKELIALWTEERVSQTEQARRLGCDRGAIARQQKKLGFVGYHPPLADSVRREIVELHKQGLSSHPIALQMGIGDRAVLRVLHEADIDLKPRRPISAKKQAAIDADIRGRKDFLCRIAKRHGVGLETVRRRKKKILGNAPLLAVWPPLQSKFPQKDAADYVPCPEEIFLELVRKLVESTAQKYIRQGRNREEVLAAKRFLKKNPTPILDKFDADLREKISKLRVVQMTGTHTVH